jgi:hypothetical protein
LDVLTLAIELFYSCFMFGRLQVRISIWRSVIMTTDGFHCFPQSLQENGGKGVPCLGSMQGW